MSFGGHTHSSLGNGIAGSYVQLWVDTDKQFCIVLGASIKKFFYEKFQTLTKLGRLMQ